MAANNMQSPSNITDEYDEPSMDTDIFVTINLILSICILVSNGFVTFLFFYKPVLLSKPSNRLLQSLSVSDFLSGVSVIFHISIQEAILNPESLYIRIIVDILTTFVVETCTIHLCMITFDRALSLFYALRYRDIVTKRTIYKVIAIVWLVPFVTSALQLTYLHPLFTDDLSEAVSDRISKIEVWYSIVSFIVYMLTPFILMGLAFFMMFREIRKLLLRTPSGQQRHLSGVSSQQRRVIYIFSIMYLCFVTLAMPYFSLRVYLDVQSWFGHHVQMDMLLLNILYTMRTATSLCNPLLYSAMNREFRSNAALLIRKTKERISQYIHSVATATPISQFSTTLSLKNRRNTTCSDAGYRDTEVFDQSLDATSVESTLCKELV